MRFFTFLLILAASPAFSADLQCFEFVRIPSEIHGAPSISHPGIVIYRSPIPTGMPSTFTRELIALNEATDDLLASLESGETVCLKGRMNHGSLARFYAYEAQKLRR